MNLLVCGSGSSEAIPALFCACRYCEEAWRRGGKDRRSRTAYMLGEEIKIDFGPDVLYHREKYNLRFDLLRHIFITHPHKDHFAPVQLLYHYYRTEEPGDAVLDLTLHGSAEVLEQMRTAPTLLPESFKLKMDEVFCHRPIVLQQSGIVFNAIPANHKCPGAVNYIIQLPNNFTIFIGTDSALFLPETWEALAQYRFDLMILDATAGKLVIQGGSHMNAEQALQTVQKIRAQGMAKENCRFLVNHFAHCGKMLHEDLESFFLPHGIEPAFDGMLIPLQ